MTDKNGKKLIPTRVRAAVLFIISGLFLCAVFGVVGGKKTVFAGEPLFGDGTFTYTGENIPGVNIYGGCTLEVFSEEEASAAGVPVGYTGSVLKLSSVKDGGCDMSFDFSASGYTRERITGVSFRMYVASTAKDDAKYPELRIPEPGKGDKWLYGGGKGAVKTDEWIIVELNDGQIDALCPDGTIKKFALCFRTNAKTVVYIDEVTVSVKTKDVEPPEISTPITTFYVEEGTYPATLAVITDNSGEFFAEYIWTDGALDELGRLLPGRHECTISVKDASNNKTEKSVSFVVRSKSDLKTCKIIFRAENEEDKTLKYSPSEADAVGKSIKLPDVPQKDHYVGRWEDFVPLKTDDQIVYAKYFPINYVVTFMADGEIVAKESYNVERPDIKEPPVPEKAGYTGKWSEYERNFSNVTVDAVYVKNAESGCNSSLDVSPLVFISAITTLFIVLTKTRKN